MVGGASATGWCAPQNELEGSRLYQQLLQTARDYFASSLLEEGEGQEEEEEGERRAVWGDPLASAGRRLAQILHTVPYSEEEVMMRCQNLGTEDGQSKLKRHTLPTSLPLPSRPCPHR